MFIWGRASYGRLGLGRDARDMYAPVEVQLPGGHQRWKIAAATAGGLVNFGIILAFWHVNFGILDSAGKTVFTFLDRASL